MLAFASASQRAGIASPVIFSLLLGELARAHHTQHTHKQTQRRGTCINLNHKPVTLNPKAAFSARGPSPQPMHCIPPSCMLLRISPRPPPRFLLPSAADSALGPRLQRHVLRSSGTCQRVLTTRHQSMPRATAAARARAASRKERPMPIPSTLTWGLFVVGLVVGNVHALLCRLAQH
jgi:hypothetical protein